MHEAERHPLAHGDLVRLRPDGIEARDDLRVLHGVAAEPRDQRAGADVEFEGVAVEQERRRCRLTAQRHLAPDGAERAPLRLLGGNVDAAGLVEAHRAGTRRRAVLEEISVVEAEHLPIAGPARRAIDDDAGNAGIGVIADQFPATAHRSAPVPMILWKITSTMTFSPMPHFADTVQPGDIEEAAAFPNIEAF
jgi:hypothetical protein